MGPSALVRIWPSGFAEQEYRVSARGLGEKRRRNSNAYIVAAAALYDDLGWRAAEYTRDLRRESRGIWNYWRSAGGGRWGTRHRTALKMPQREHSTSRSPSKNTGPLFRTIKKIAAQITQRQKSYQSDHRHRTGHCIAVNATLARKLLPRRSRKWAETYQTTDRN